MTLLTLEVPLMATSLTKVTVTGPPQPSVAVTEPTSGGGTSEKHCTLRGGAHDVMIGVLDREIVWAHVAVCPWVFVAVHVRVMIGPAQFEPVIVSVKLVVT